jgi:hypothetical protein
VRKVARGAGIKKGRKGRKGRKEGAYALYTSSAVIRTEKVVKMPARIRANGLTSGLFMRRKGDAPEFATWDLNSPAPGPHLRPWLSMTGLTVKFIANIIERAVYSSLRGGTAHANSLFLLT